MTRAPVVETRLNQVIRSRLGEATKPTSSTRLVLICGLPASGKSTLARQLTAEMPAIRLDKDQWTTQLGFDVWDDEFRVLLEAQLWALTQELLAQGQSVILSGAIGREWNEMRNDSELAPWGSESNCITSRRLSRS